MMNLTLMLMVLLAAMGSAGMHSTIISLKLAQNYRNSVQEFHKVEGLAEKALGNFANGGDGDQDGTEDFQQIHSNNDSVYYAEGGYLITISRHPTNPHLATIQVGSIEITVNNFPGGGESCVHSGQCTPERVAWRDYL